MEPVLLASARVLTFNGSAPLTNASGFFFRRDRRLFLVTSRHVFLDEASGHRPNRIEIEVHVDAKNMGKSINLSIPLFKGGRSVWRDGFDGGGAIDVAAIEIIEDALPDTSVLRAFRPAHIRAAEGDVAIGATILIPGFPLGFHDTLHHMPVVRQAGVASSFGLRFQGLGYFLTDARTHRGLSGAPVVMRSPEKDPALGDLQWRLLGVHSSRLDIGTRDFQLDEALGLNCAWYADILMTLTEG